MPVNCYSSFDDLPPGLSALFPAAHESLFESLDWFRLLSATTIKAPEELHIFGLEEDSAFVAAIVLKSGTPSTLSLNPRTLSACANFYTMNFAPVFADSVDQEAILARLFRAVRGEKPNWDIVTMSPLDSDNRVTDTIKSALDEAGFLARSYFEFGNWFEPIGEGGFEEFVGARPSRLRNTWKRRSRKLERDFDTRIVLTTTQDGLAESLQAYHSIYEGSWKEPEQFPDFIPALVSKAAELGVLRMGTLYVDEQPAAAQLWLIDGHKAVIYKLAYDEKYRDLSVGTVLTMKLAEHAIEVDKVKEIDYGSGDDSYKKEWMSKRREKSGVIGCNPATLPGLAIGLREKGAAAVAHLRR